MQHVMTRDPGSPPPLTVRLGPAFAERLSEVHVLPASALMGGCSLSSCATLWMYSDTRPTKSCGWCVCVCREYVKIRGKRAVCFQRKRVPGSGVIRG